MKAILLILCFISLAAYGEESELRTFGYVTQTATKANGVSLSGSKNDWSFDKREIALFGDYGFSHGWTFRFAVGTMDEPAMRTGGEGDVYVKYLLLDHQWSVDADSLGFRFGKVPHEFGFHNTTRNAPASSQYIYLPEGLPGYHEGFKYVAMSGIGAQAYWNHSINDSADFSITATHTKAEFGNNREVVAAFVNDNNFGTFDKHKSTVTDIAITGRYTTFVAYYNWIKMDFMFNFDKPWSYALTDGYIDTRVHVFGVKKYFDEFEVGGEYLTVRFVGDTWRSLRTADEGYPTGWVYYGTWHATPKLDLSLYHTEYYVQIGDKDGSIQAKAAALTGAYRPEHWYYTKANSIAAKYAIDDRWTVKAQATKGEGLANFAKSVNKTTGKDWSYFSIQLVYSF